MSYYCLCLNYIFFDRSNFNCFEELTETFLCLAQLIEAKAEQWIGWPVHQVGQPGLFYCFKGVTVKFACLNFRFDMWMSLKQLIPIVSEMSCENEYMTYVLLTLLRTCDIHVVSRDY